MRSVIADDVATQRRILIENGVPEDDLDDWLDGYRTWVADQLDLVVEEGALLGAWAA